MIDGLTERGERELRNQTVRNVSRTFALSIDVLPGTLRDAMGIAYLMFRVSDGIEDHPDLLPATKVRLLELWASSVAGKASVDEFGQAVRELPGSTHEVAAVRNAAQIVGWLNELPSSYQAPIRTHVIATSTGMARWQKHGPYIEDELALDDYMHEVAGRVGYLVTDLYALHSPAIRSRRDSLMALSRECGLALQTVNVLRGLGDDRQREWVFVPRSFYERYGLTRDSLFDPYHQKDAMRVVELLVDKAKRHLDFGLAYIMGFPRTEHRLRLSVMWPFLFAARTLAICEGNPLVFQSQAKMDRSEVKSIITRSSALGWSNAWLRRYYAELLQRPTNPAYELTASRTATAP